MTTRNPAEGRRRTWTLRILKLLGCWLVLWVLTGWLQMRPQPLGLLAALGVLFTVFWWVNDRQSHWDPIVWEGDPVGRRLRSNSDSRISYLRRLIDDASSRKDNGASPSATSLQNILRDITVDRLRLRAAVSGATHLPDDSELLGESDPQLAQYLRAQPAPPMNRQSVTDIINRIEAL